MKPKSMLASLSVITLLLVIGCATTEQLAPRIDLSMKSLAMQEGYSIEQLERGRRLYITDCATCHSPEPVVRYSQRQWDEIMPRMARETRMSAQDEQAVAAYVRFILQNPPQPNAEAIRTP